MLLIPATMPRESTQLTGKIDQYFLPGQQQIRNFALSLNLPARVDRPPSLIIPLTDGRCECERKHVLFINKKKKRKENLFYLSSICRLWLVSLSISFKCWIVASFSRWAWLGLMLSRWRKWLMLWWRSLCKARSNFSRHFWMRCVLAGFSFNASV